MLNIPFYKPSLTSAEIDEVVETLKSGWLTTGGKTKQFERDFAAYLGHRNAVAVNSCTAALHLALEAIGVQPGDGVLVPTMTFAATAEVVRCMGGNPILVDCRESDFNLDAADAERRLLAATAQGQRVAAIMPVHYGGQIGDVEGYSALAKKYNLKIVEDAAHCCPAYFRTVEPAPSDEPLKGPLTPALSPAEGERVAAGRERGIFKGEANPEIGQPNQKLETRNSKPSAEDWLPVGRSADISCFSFYANKCITTGEGGMACSENDSYADRMRIMSLHGISRDAWKRYTAEGSWYYEIIAPGYKYNLTDVASAMGIHQLRRADDFHRRRCEVVKLYKKTLEDVEELILPEENPDRIHSWHLFVLRLRLDCLTINRSEFIDRLKEAGIGTSVHYTPLHMHPYYREKFGYRPEDLPVMAAVYPQIVTLPVYPGLSDDEVEHVCRTVRKIVTQHRKFAQS